MECQKFAETEMNQYFGKTLVNLRTNTQVIVEVSKQQHNLE
jgi:hypothetical protein